MSEPVVILGAGLAGLSCAHHLSTGYRLIEKQEEVGGAARSFTRAGFLFDITGHWLHLRDDAIRRLAQRLLPDGLATIRRRAAIHSHGIRTPYPFQANTHGLPVEVSGACVLGYFRAREAAARGHYPEPKSFEAFIRQRMGDGIAEHFMIPYNTKFWTVPPAELSPKWCGRFVPVPTPEEILDGALTPGGVEALGYNVEFFYPGAGGIDRLPTALNRQLERPAETGMEAARINWRERTVVLADGSRVAYGALVSTMPLDAFIAGLIDPPEPIREAAQRLRSVSVTYWDIGVTGANAPGDAHWVYFPEANVPFYRVGSASAAAPHLAPDGHRSYYVEVSHPRGTPCPATEAEVLEGLRRVDILDQGEEPVLVVKNRIDCAYVLMDHDYGAAREILLSWLSSQGILSVGRYGAWTYDSMEGAMIQGREAAARIRET